MKLKNVNTLLYDEERGETMQKITCWYRVISSKWMRWNHFTYGWTNRATPLPVNKKQEQMWEGAKWDKKYGYLIDGVVKESEG